jgi:biotin carboxylase
MNKRIMVLGASVFQIPLIRKCKELGYQTIVADYDERAPGLGLADIPLIISSINRAEIYKAARQYNINGIVTTSDYPVRTVAYVSSKIGLPGLSEQSAYISTHKYELRKKLRQGGFSVPEFHLISNLENPDNYNNFPYIIKPVDSSGSRGVKKISSKQELINGYSLAKKFSKSKEVIIEGYIDGKEYSVETLTQNGQTHVIAVTEKYLHDDNGNYFVEFAHIVPGVLNDDLFTKIERISKNVIKTIGIDNSNNTEVVIIEVGARLGGDLIGSELVPLATGVDMLKNVAHLSVGELIDVGKKHNRYAGIQFLTSENYHHAKEYVMKSSKGIQSYSFDDYKKIEIKSSFDRLGYIILCFNDRNTLLSTLNKINNL